MKNAFSRLGRTCVSLLLGGVLTAGAMLAGNVNQISLTIPHTVTVGSTVLPSGHYTISSYAIGGEEYFLVRGDNGNAVTLAAQLVTGDASERTEVVFSRDGETWRFDKLTLAGDGNSYQFLGIK